MPISNGSLEDENCSDITDWNDLDAVPAVSFQCTFDGKECFCFDTNASAAGNDYALRQKNIGSVDGLGNRIVISLKLYCDAIGTRVNADDYRLDVFRSDWAFTASFASDGLYIYDGSAMNEVGTNLVVQDTWQEWTFDVDISAGVANAVCDVYLDNVLQASDVDCSYIIYLADGRVNLMLQGFATDDRLAYVDWFKVGDAFSAENLKINIVDAFKDASDVKINIGDAWKDVTEMKINIGDVWKTIF